MPIQFIKDKKYKNASKKDKRALRKIQRTLEKKMKPIEKISMEQQRFNDWTLYQSTKNGITPLMQLQHTPVKYEITDYMNFKLYENKILPIDKSSSTQTYLLTKIYDWFANFMNSAYPKCVPTRLV